MKMPPRSYVALRRAHAAHKLLIAALAASVSCGDNGGGTGKLPAASTSAARCAAPRSGKDPLTGKPYVDTQGTAADEKAWLRAWTDDLYLWYREVPAVDPAAYATPVDYFAALKTPAATPSGRPKDQFHFTYATADWEALSQSGVELGYGAQWLVLSPTPPRQIVVAYTEPGSPAENAGIRRGAQVVAIDDTDVDATDKAGIDKLNAGLSPTAADPVHSFTLLDPGATSPRTLTVTAANVASAPVQDVAALPTASGPVGYMLFNDHLATAEAALVDAVHQLESDGVTDLVLDIRYNGGGYLAVASELAYMIAGPAATAGRTFERTVFNDRFPTYDPFSGQPLVPMPFLDTTIGLSSAAGEALPHLDLKRVFVLTGSGTCSASESVMNGLRGIGVDVVQVGASTCGKPYGFVPQDNCGTTYFSIQFQGVNAQGFGDYADGFTPGGTGAAGLPGCPVADDLAHELGDPGEARLAAALAYRDTASCPSSPAALAVRAMSRAASAPEGSLLRSQARENRILRW